MEIHLSDHFSAGRLIRFAVPSVFMMLFTSIYGVVDGFFVSNFAGETAFAGVNFIMPYLMGFSAIGFMLGTGGNALVSMLLGQGKKDKARRVFSMLIYFTFGAGLIFMVISQIFLRPVAAFLGAEGELLEICVRYGRIINITLPVFMLQCAFQSFLVTAEKPKLGLYFILGAGISNMILDALFVAVFGWGVRGAAAATCIGECIGGLGPLIYFCLPNSSLLRLGKTSFDIHALLKACSNGAAEFLSNISMSMVNMLYNYQLMRLAGEYGVSAFGIIMYVNFIFISVFIGYSMGAAPIIGFNYGAQNYSELKNVFRTSLRIIGTASAILMIGAQLSARFLAGVFAGYNEEFLAISISALRIYSVNYLFSGINIFTSNAFAALNNGRFSAILSSVRVLGLQTLCVLIIPVFLGVTGIWLSMVIAESCTMLITFILIGKYRTVYHY